MLYGGLCVSKADESGAYHISFLILCLFKVIFYFLPWWITIKPPFEEYYLFFQPPKKQIKVIEAF